MRRFPIALLLTFVLSACGGGGGNTTSLPSLSSGGAAPSNGGAAVLPLPKFYTVVDLGAFVQPAAINNRNTVAGTVFRGDSTNAFIYRNGKLVSFPAQSHAVAINDNDVAVGDDWQYMPDGSEQSLGSVNSAVALQALGIDDDGHIFGLAFQAGVAGCNGALTLLSASAPPNVIGGQSSTLVVSRSGKVVLDGYSQTGNGCTGTIQPFYYPGNAPVPLPSDLTLDVNTSLLSGVNDAGDVVGYSQQNGTGKIVTFFAHHGIATEIAPPAGYQFFEAAAVNNADWIVGNESNQKTVQAFVWVNGTITNLNTRLSASCSQWVLQTATGVNDAGYIVGVGTLNGASHGYLLVPSST